MAFVARTTRESNPIGNPFRQPESGANIGPGSYNLTGSAGRKAPSYVPFSSSTTRGASAAGPAFVPGPGQYDYATPLGPGHSKAVMETPFSSFAERFADKVTGACVPPCVCMAVCMFQLVIVRMRALAQPGL